MIIDQYSFRTVRENLLTALNDMRSEPKLFSIRINERTLTQRLSMKLQPHFEGVLSVDCEYNRMWNGSDMSKVLPCAGRSWTDDDDGRTVYPDVIVHIRDEPFENLLVVEAKRNHRGRRLPKRDATKLHLFTDPDGDFHYRFGAFVNFLISQENKNISVVWFLEGDRSDIVDTIPISASGGAT